MRNIHLISHTHWDREWYRSYQYFRVKLVFVVDKILKILENDPDFKHFLLDGQSVVLEDYLEIKPENRDRIQKLVEAGRLSVGPWYVQPDEFVPSGESMVRNLLIGIGLAESFGRSMMVGYLPDSFGQSGQMPHILRGFGIDSAVVMRGVDAAGIGRSEFIWTGTNGDEVLGIYLPEGYSNAMFLPEDHLKARARLACMIGKLRKWSATKNILIMNGVDHQFPQAHIPDMIKRLNSRGRKIHYQMATLEGYIDAVRSAEAALPGLEGDLLVPGRNRVHSSIASTRIYQKQKNRQMEALLTKYVEPLAVIGWLQGAEYPSGLIGQAWKILLQNQTHDGIGGCCTDAVHREMDQRFEDVRSIGETLRNAYGRAISQRISDEKLALTVFNSGMVQGDQIVRASIYIKEKEFNLVDSDGNSIPYQVESSEEVDLAELSIWTLYLKTPEIAHKVDIAFQASFDFNVGYRIYQIQEGKTGRVLNHNLNPGEPFRLENEYLRVDLNPNGSLNLLDKSSGEVYPELLVFEDCGDAGDTYNYSPVKNDQIVTSGQSSAEIEWVEAGDLKQSLAISHALEVPRSLVNQDQDRSKETVILPIKTLVTLYAGQKRLDFCTEVNNTALDHRLRVLFPSGLNVSHASVETQFGTVERPIQIDTTNWKKEKLHEKPLPIYAMHKFVSLANDSQGLAVLNRGLPEYEIYGEDKAVIAVTLLRGVGMMGKNDLAVRPGRPSGMSLPTPDAQSLGKQRLEYAVVPQQGNFDEDRVPSQAAAYDAPPLAVQSFLDLKKIKRRFGVLQGMVSLENLTFHLANQLDHSKWGDLKLMTITDPRLVISAVKKSEVGDALVIRIYNSSSVPVENSSISLGVNFGEGHLASFKEEELEPLLKLEAEGYSLPLIKPNSAVTLKFLVDQQQE